jgi:hypothetical protein
MDGYRYDRSNEKAVKQIGLNGQEALSFSILFVLHIPSVFSQTPLNYRWDSALVLLFPNGTERESGNDILLYQNKKDKGR